MNIFELGPINENRVEKFKVGGAQVDLRLGKMMDQNLGIEGEKFYQVDVFGLRLGFNKGFVTVASDEIIDRKYTNWKSMKNDGLGNYLVRNCVKAELPNSNDLSALITEDLRSEGWDVYEFNMLYRRNILPGKIVGEANQYMFNYIDQLNLDSDPVKNIQQIKDNGIKAVFSWFADVYINQFKKDNLPLIDPYMEKELFNMLQMMKEKNWTARTESIFLMTRKNNKANWPYERKVILGDIGEGIYKGSPGGLDTKHLDSLYHFCDKYYRQK